MLAELNRGEADASTQQKPALIMRPSLLSEVTVRRRLLEQQVTDTLRVVPQLAERGAWDGRALEALMAAAVRMMNLAQHVTELMHAVSGQSPLPPQRFYSRITCVSDEAMLQWTNSGTLQATPAWLAQLNKLVFNSMRRNADYDTWLFFSSDELRLLLKSLRSEMANASDGRVRQNAQFAIAVISTIVTQMRAAFSPELRAYASAEFLKDESIFATDAEYKQATLTISRMAVQRVLALDWYGKANARRKLAQKQLTDQVETMLVVEALSTLQNGRSRRGFQRLDWGVVDNILQFAYGPNPMDSREAMQTMGTPRIPLRLADSYARRLEKKHEAARAAIKRVQLEGVSVTAPGKIAYGELQKQASERLNQTPKLESDRFTWLPKQVRSLDPTAVDFAIISAVLSTVLGLLGLMSQFWVIPVTFVLSAVIVQVARWVSDHRHVPKPKSTAFQQVKAKVKGHTLKGIKAMRGAHAIPRAMRSADLAMAKEVHNDFRREVNSLLAAPTLAQEAAEAKAQEQKATAPSAARLNRFGLLSRLRRGSRQQHHPLPSQPQPVVNAAAQADNVTQEISA